MKLRWGLDFVLIKMVSSVVFLFSCKFSFSVWRCVFLNVLLFHSTCLVGFTCAPPLLCSRKVDAPLLDEHFFFCKIGS